jgi:hypothetical protein
VGTATLILLSLAAIGSQPHGLSAEDSVDVIEINHFVNESGQVQLDQIIFYDWSPSQSRYIVRAWRSLKTPSQLPMKLAGGGYQATWHDSRDGNVLRKVKAKSVIETWTTYDPETVNQEYLDRNLRRELAQRKPARAVATRTPALPFNAGAAQATASR